MSFSYILDINTLSDISFENILFHSVGCLSVEGFLRCAEVFKFLLILLNYEFSGRNYPLDLMDIGGWDEYSGVGDEVLRMALKQLKVTAVVLFMYHYFISRLISFCHVHCEVSVVGF